MHQDLPSHISELISLLKSVSDPELVLMSYIKHLPCDPYLYSTFMSLSYNPSKGEFDDLPRTERIVSALQTEYSSLPLPCKRSYSDLSETSSDKARCSKGLKVLSARVKSILLSKRLNSYREVAQELIKELNIVSKTEEKNILRRVYDALNVLIAAGAVAKNGNEYEWVECVECVEPENEILKEKRLKLKALKEKLTAAQGLMKRNKQEEEKKKTTTQTKKTTSTKQKQHKTTKPKNHKKTQPKNDTTKT